MIRPWHLLLALLLHIVLIGGGVLGGVLWSEPHKLPQPPIIEATLLDPTREQVAEQKRIEAEQAAAEERRQAAERERARQQAAAEARRAEEEAARQQAAAEAEAQRLADIEAQRKAAAEAEAKRQAEEAARQAAEEAERRRKAEEQRLAREQAEREASLREELAREQAAREERQAVAALASVLNQHIRRHWDRPPDLQSAGLTCQLRITVLPDGTVTSAQVVDSSGHASFDRSAERAVTRASPLPPPPDGYRHYRTFLLNFDPS